MNRLLKLRDVEEAVGLCRASIYARIQSGEFPAPVKIGRSSRWPATEVDQWIDSQILRCREQQPS